MAKLQNFLRRPRYLRAIPSLMVLTTAMAWGVTPDADVDEAVHRKPQVTLSQTSVQPPQMLLLPAPTPSKAD